jgi:hypothetical protein
MTFEEILDHAMAMLQRRGRLTYSTLKRQFQLDDAAPVFRYVRTIAARLWLRLNLTRTISARFQYLRTNAIDGARSLQYLLSHVRRRMDLGLAVFFPRREKSKDEVRYARKSIGVI